jgi:hypothetical protein
MTKVYGSWEPNTNNSWNRFTLTNADIYGKGGCGSIHKPVNTSNSYDWSNTSTVTSSCIGYLGYPNLTGQMEHINCSAWGCTSLGYLKYWYSHLPYANGVNVDGKLNNWWAYIIDPQNNIVSEGAFTGLSSQSTNIKAVFSFGYTGGVESYRIDLSTLPDMSTDVYVNFASGIAGPLTNINPTGWDKYACGKTLFWRVVAQDTGKEYLSSIQSTTVACDTTPPVANITKPTNNSQVSRNTTVTIAATATDASGIAKVEFYVNNVLKCIDLTSAYSCNWQVPSGRGIKYTILAKAYDVFGNLADKSIVVTSK